MSLCKQLAKHFKDVYFGGNWTSVNFKDVLTDVRWQQAITPVSNLNTIADLTYHTNYYVQPVTQVLRGKELIASDRFSFDTPEITSDTEWSTLLSRVFEEAEELSWEIEQMDETLLFKDFTDPKYGSYYRNLSGVIEHCHYHLGQIVLIKKILQGQ
ncbi:DUF1572 domain-containing protein [Pedobacter sp. AW1-32]|uniref:DUF1572 domain-containing protein n=1 Tax=Pedobacter sp. AW1-32 TaxID=3383026 RepID=UPI003FF029BF